MRRVVLVAGSLAVVALAEPVAASTVAQDRVPRRGAATARVKESPCDAAVAAAKEATGDVALRAQAWVAAGNCLFDANLPTPAIEAYDRALALVPDQADVLSDQAVMYERLDRHGPAVENLRRAIRIAPRHLQSWWNLAYVYRYGVHDEGRAAVAYQKVIELAPGSPQAIVARAYVDAYLAGTDPEDEAVDDGAAP